MTKYLIILFVLLAPLLVQGQVIRSEAPVCSFSLCELPETKQIITGDLFFGFFRLGSYYNRPDSLVDKVKTYFDTLDLKTASEDDKRFAELYKIISDKNLIDKPYVDILIQPDSVIMLYLDKEDYDKIKIYKRQELQDDNKKVVISAFVTKYSQGILFCDSLNYIKKVDGQTLLVQKKFRLEDYK